MEKREALKKALVEKETVDVINWLLHKKFIYNDYFYNYSTICFFLFYIVNREHESFSHY